MYNLHAASPLIYYNRQFRQPKQPVPGCTANKWLSKTSSLSAPLFRKGALWTIPEIKFVFPMVRDLIQAKGAWCGELKWFLSTFQNVDRHGKGDISNCFLLQLSLSVPLCVWDAFSEMETIFSKRRTSFQKFMAYSLFTCEHRVSSYPQGLG